MIDNTNKGQSNFNYGVPDYDEVLDNGVQHDNNTDYKNGQGNNDQK